MMLVIYKNNQVEAEKADGLQW